MLPRALKRICARAFYNCSELEKVCVEDGCEASLSQSKVPGFARITLPPETMAGDIRALGLNTLQNVVIPNGVERVGNHWFWYHCVKRVEIPASVREIGADAFCHCRHLEHVTFAPGSRLEKIGAGSFYDTNISRVLIPKGVTEVQCDAFGNCTWLREVAFEEGSRLERIGERAFS